MKIFNLKMLLVACTVVSAYSVKAEGAPALTAETVKCMIDTAIKGHTDGSFAHDRIPNMIAKLLSLPIRGAKAILGFPVTCAKAVGNGCVSVGSSVKNGTVNGFSGIKNGCGSVVGCLKDNKKAIALTGLAAVAIVAGSYVVHQLFCPAIKQIAELEARIAQTENDELEAEFAI